MIFTEFIIGSDTSSLIKIFQCCKSYDENGGIAKSYTYDVFGVEKNILDSGTNPFRYCGEYFDTETGTIYLRARYYNPTISRFISRDSVTGKIEDPLSLNLYTYCHNNPILGVDPSGHWSIKGAIDEWCDFLGDVGEKTYDLDTKLMDCWQSEVNHLKNSNSIINQSFGSFCEGYNNFSNDLYNGSKYALKCGKAAVTSLELDFKAGTGIGGKAGVLNNLAKAELIWTPVKECWKIDRNGCNVEHIFSESVGISAFNIGFRAYNEALYNENEYQTKGFAYANLGKSSYGIEAYFLGVDYLKDFGTNTSSYGLNYTIFDVEAYALIGGGISLKFDADNFFEKVKN